MNLDVLSSLPRLLLQVRLEPLQGTRFQPTGFADLGAATYVLPDDRNTQMLLLESAQSVANRLEAVCWDAAADDLVAPLRGLPYIRVSHGGKPITNSILEAHRINSPYILDSTNRDFVERLSSELGADSAYPVDLPKAARAIMRYDPNSVLHGVFLARKELAGGRIRLQRLLSGFIEAADVRPADSGGVKNDRVNPSGEARLGYGNVPFHRTEYVAREITAYFNFDLASMRGYGLGQEANDLLAALALYKIQSFLLDGLRLRTACDLRTVGVLTATNVELEIPSLGTLAKVLPDLIEQVPYFGQPRVVELSWDPPKKTKPSDGDTAGEESDAG